jgi:hypothetical protein
LPIYYGANTANVFTDQTTNLKPTNAAANPMMYRISPAYFDAAGTVLLAGRAFTWHDDKNSPRVAVVNREFANKIFGSLPNALGRYFKAEDGARVQVVGIVVDGKYANLTEDSQPAMFLPMQQSLSSQVAFVVRSNRDPQQLAAAIKSKVKQLDEGLPFDIQTWNRLRGVSVSVFPERLPCPLSPALTLAP